MESNSTPRVWASLGATINIGNYENQKIDIGISGIPIDSTPEYIESQMKLAKATLHTIVNELADEMLRRMKEDYGK